MYAYLRRGPHQHTAARLRRIIVVLAVAACGVLGWAATAPAASASIIRSQVTVPTGPPRPPPSG